MIIGVDAGCLGTTDNRLKAGVYYVTLHTLLELSRIDTKNTYVLYSFHPIANEVMRSFPATWKNVVLSSKGWLYISLPLQFLRQKPDLFLAFSQAMPWYHPCKIIGFIHGLDFLPEFHQERNKKLQRNSEYLIRHADVLVTTSMFLKKSLEDTYHAKSIVVSPLGIDVSFTKQKTQYKHKKPYFLFVGSLKPSKNIPRILSAFSLFLKKSKEEFDLLCIGSDFWLDPEVTKKVQALHLTDNIIFIPSVANSDLVPYYRGATALVSPSLYEGFGLPFVEAMTAGCPVIGSTAGAIPEIVRDAGILVDPHDVTGLANAMNNVAMDKKLRDDMKKKGIERAKKFSWEDFASDVLTVIDSV